MSRFVKVGPKYQIVIPKEVREKLGLRPGQKVLVEYRDGFAILVPRPRSFTKFLMGLGREVWEGVDAEAYVREEREGWGG